MDALFPPGTDLCTIPAGQAPAGETYNFVDPPSLSAAVIAIGVIMSVWSTVFTCGRLYANRKQLALADYCMIVGLISALGFTAVIISLHRYDRRQWNVPVCWIDSLYMKKIYAETFLVGPALYFPKSAIFLMFLQIFSVSPAMRMAIYFGLLMTFLIYFPSLPLSSYYLTPRPGQTWEDLLTNGAPQHLVYWGVVQGSLSIALDIYILILPIPVLSRLHLPFRKKLQLVALFATAVMGVVASTVALVYRVQVLESLHDLGTWEQACVAICIICENNVAIIVGSMPGFAKFSRQNIAESSIFRSLRSRLLSGGSFNSPSKGSKLKSHKPEIQTFRTPEADNQPPYIELTDSMLLKSQVSSQGDDSTNRNRSGEDSYRSVDIVQHTR